jgi:hypothetical protein
LFAFTTTVGPLFAATANIDTTVNPTNMPIILLPGFSNGGMSDEYRANLDPATVEYQLRVIESKLSLTAWCVYVSTLWCLKTCIAIYYTRLTWVTDHTCYGAG